MKKKNCSDSNTLCCTGLELGIAADLTWLAKCFISQQSKNQPKNPCSSTFQTLVVTVVGWFRLVVPDCARYGDAKAAGLRSMGNLLQNHRVKTLLSRVRCVYYIDLHNSLNLNKLHLHSVQQCRQVSTSFFFLPVRLCLGSCSVKLLSQCNVVWLVHKGSYSATMEREGRGKEERHVWVCVCAKHG